MKLVFRILLLVSVAAVAALGQISRFEHIIVVVQENRSPDNLFYALCAKFPCSTNPNNQQYNIQTANWLDNTSSTGVTQPTGVALANGYDLSHGHPGWKNQCDLNTSTQQCRMDGAASNHINRGAFVFVINAPDAKHPQGIIASYLTLATQYGWANFMFQTNQGPSFPSHQFIFGGTSALDPISDQMGIFLSENFDGASGCYAQDGERNRLIGPNGHETFFTIDYATGKTACSTRPTMADLLDGKGISWKYYSVKGAGTDGGGSLWTAPAAIEPICKPDALHQSCTGAEWAKHVDLNSAHVLSDLGMNGSPCNLPAVSWVIPTGVNSDHPGTARDGGPDWVATVVNALGTSPCTDTINNRPVSYWKDTAVIITWDDWGGFYDHVPPPILPFPQGGYQMGFRVPLIFVSAYTPARYINNANHNFGSMLRFIEHNFDLGEGALGFADSRGDTTNLTGFYKLTSTPREFVQIPTQATALDFLNDTTPPTDPDDD